MEAKKPLLNAYDCIDLLLTERTTLLDSIKHLKKTQTVLLILLGILGFSVLFSNISS